MSTKTPDTVGTRVESPSANTEFQLVTTYDEPEECAAPGCHREPSTRDELSLVLGADMEGMFADYGDVEFCSLECAREFVNLGTLYELETLEAIGAEVAIFPGSPVVAHVSLGDYPEPVHSALGHDIEAAVDAATTWFVDEAETLAAVDDEESIEDYSITVEHL